MESYQVTDPESHDYELNKEMLNDILEKTVIGWKLCWVIGLFILQFYMNLLLLLQKERFFIEK